MSTRTVLRADALQRALRLPDLTDSVAAGPHAMQTLLHALVAALRAELAMPVVVHRAPPIVAAQDNYDALRYPTEALTRDARYTRWIDERHLLRSHTSAMIPAALRDVARGGWPEVLVVCPGLVYRRDQIDRLHVGEPHQVDLWCVRREGTPLGESDLECMIAAVVASALPGRTHRTEAREHPYTERGRQIDVRQGADWIEIGECGLAHPQVLAASGCDPKRGYSGLAMGLGLDRLLMLRKHIDDIRLLRSEDPRVRAQMLDLERYRPVSNLPATARDLSVAVDAEQSVEELGDRVREALGQNAGSVEEVSVLSETSYAQLPAAAHARMGMEPHHKNVLLRVVLRHPTRTLAHAEANALRDRIYAALHQGGAHEWAGDTRD